jgi:FkbM family methyltransferase
MCCWWGRTLFLLYCVCICSSVGVVTERPCLDAWIVPIDERLPAEQLVLDIAGLYLQSQDGMRSVDVQHGYFDEDHPVSYLLDEDATTFFRLGRWAADAQPYLRAGNDQDHFESIVLTFSDNEHKQNILNYQLVVTQRSCAVKFTDKAALSSFTAARQAGNLSILIVEPLHMQQPSEPLPPETAETATGEIPLMVQVVFNVPVTHYDVRTESFLMHSFHGQELEVLHALAGKRRGLFVDIGASNGVLHSNTYTLERYFQWTGLLVEPLPRHRSSLVAHRPQSFLLHACVFNRTFLATDFVEGVQDNWEHSGLAVTWPFAGRDGYHSGGSEAFRHVSVPCFHVNDVLEAHGLMRHIDFLSIDVEGGDWIVVQAIDWTRFSAAVVCVEKPHEDGNTELAMVDFFMRTLHYSSWKHVGWDLMFFK